MQPVAGQVALPKRKPLLAQRQDLSLHFIYSAAIKLLSEQGMSAAIGEFKELMDRGNGGSGFSFVDLAADLAGVEFAKSATNELKARQFQYTLAGNTLESTFFPDISALPEGLSKSAFNQQFKQVDSPEYKAMLTNIRQRIASLPIHN